MVNTFENGSPDSLAAQRSSIDATSVAKYFDKSVTKIRDNNGNIATRAENGFFYLPAKSGTKAFYLAKGESATTLERGRVISNSVKEKAQKEVYPESRRQQAEVRQDVQENALTIRGPKNAYDTANSFAQNVVSVKCSDGQIATRAENGYFYLPGKSGSKAFYLAKGENAIAAQFNNNVYRNTGREDIRRIQAGTKLNLSASIDTYNTANNKYLEFSKLNKDIYAAVARDMNGPVIEGGLIGIFQKHSALQDALNKMPPNVRSSVEAQLNELAASYRDIRGIGGGFWDGFKGMFGIRSESYQKAVLMRGLDKRKESAATAIAAAAISLIASGGTSLFVYLGNLKLPFKIQSIPSVKKDVAAYALYGESSYNIERDAWESQNVARFDAANSSQKNIRANRGKLSSAAQTAQSLEKDTQGSGDTALRMQLDRQLYEQLSLEQGPKFTYMLQMVTSCNNIGEFERKYTLPSDPTVRAGIKTFYTGGKAPNGITYKKYEGRLLADMMSDPNMFQGAAGMAHVQMWKNNPESRRNGQGMSPEEFARKYRSKAGDIVKESKAHNDSYAGKISNINDRGLVSEYFDKRPLLLAAYERKINELMGGIDVSAANIQQSIKNYGTPVEKWKGMNTGLNTRNLDRSLWQGGALLVPIVVNGRYGPGIQMIGIKPDCANLIIGSFYPDSFIQRENPGYRINLRVPVGFNLSLGGPGVPAQRSGPNQPEPTPSGPGNPLPNPSGPGNPLPTGGVETHIGAGPISEGIVTPAGPGGHEWVGVVNVIGTSL